MMLTMTFHSFDLNPNILKAIAEAGYTQPTPIQLEAIPHVLTGRDIRGSAHTGTGKTAAFLVPALHRLATTKPQQGKGPRLLILVPTRELGMQIAGQAEKYSTHMPRMRTLCIGGGVPYSKQLPKLSRPYDILVATPGRLIDFMHRKKISLERLDMLVLDEADRMLDMGFVQPVEEIVAAAPSSRQTLLFSATLEGSVKKLSQRILRDPVDVTIESHETQHANIDQKLHYVDTLSHKTSLLDHILSDNDVYTAIIFTSTKRYADQLVAELGEKGHRAGALHGDMNQRQRSRTIASLQKGKIRILVATDVAARGIHVDSITHVINFDLPFHPEDYVHRIGRTGRAGAKGTALSFASPRDRGIVKQIERFTKRPFDIVTIPGLEPKQREERPFRKKPRKRPFAATSPKRPHFRKKRR